jgi:hypothetical protein
MTPTERLLNVYNGTNSSKAINNAILEPSSDVHIQERGWTGPRGSAQTIHPLSLDGAIAAGYQVLQASDGYVIMVGGSGANCILRALALADTSGHIIFVRASQPEGLAERLHAHLLPLIKLLAIASGNKHLDSEKPGYIWREQAGLFHGIGSRVSGVQCS